MLVGTTETAEAPLAVAPLMKPPNEDREI